MCFKSMLMLTAIFLLRLPGVQCIWSVTHSSTRVCGLEGASLVLPCKYEYSRSDTYFEGGWFNEKGRVSEHSNSEYPDCSLNIDKLSYKHSGVYHFWIRINPIGFKNWITGQSGVTVSVTHLQVLITPEAVKEGENVTLTCNTTCILSNNPTFIWYKNRQPVTLKHTTRDNRLHLNRVSSEDVGSYSCAVRRHKSLFSTDVFLKVRYKPKSVSVSISPGEIVEGSSVTLTCSSDANPPVHNYNWYMKTGAESLIRGTGDSISFNVTSDSSGRYYCEAENEVGSQTSTGVAVPTEEVAGIILPAIITMIIIFAFLLLLGFVCLRSHLQNSKKKAEITAERDTITDMQNDSGLVYSTVTARATTSDPAQRVPTSDQNDIQYASVQINHSKTQEVPLYSPVQKPQTSTQDDDVIYSSVQFLRGRAATRAEIDVIYSAVIKP